MSSTKRPLADVDGADGVDDGNSDKQSKSSAPVKWPFTLESLRKKQETARMAERARIVEDWCAELDNARNWIESDAEAGLGGCKIQPPGAAITPANHALLKVVEAELKERLPDGLHGEFNENSEKVDTVGWCWMEDSDGFYGIKIKWGPEDP